MFARADLAHAAGRALRGSAGPKPFPQHLHQLRSAPNAISLTSAASALVRRLSGPLHLRSFATAPATETTRAKAAKGTATASKRTAASTSTKPKSAAKETAAKKPKKRAVKAKGKPTKKVLTEKQVVAQAKRKEKATKQKAKDHLRALREAALLAEEPKRPLASAFLVYMTEKLRTTASPVGAPAAQSALFKEYSESYKQLPPAEIERLNHKVVELQENYEKAYKQWVSSYSAAEVDAANKARASLKRLATKRDTDGIRKKAPQGLSPIRDERLPKLPQRSFVLFTIDRRSSGDFKNMSVQDISKLLSEEWKKLGAGAKKKYDDLVEADVQRYQREYKAAFGKEYVPTKQAASAAS